MFIEMIDRHMFQEFIRNSTATVLEGNFVTGSARTHYYRIVRVPLAIGEHYIEALYGHQCYSGPNSMGSTIFSTNDPLEFMAFVVDHKDFYNETYQFLTLFDDSWVNIQPHGTSNSMATALWQYLDNKTVLGESDLQDASLQREAYEKAVNQYVLHSYDIDEKTAKTFREFLERIDNTASIEFLANPTDWAERVVAVLDRDGYSDGCDNKPFSESRGKNAIALYHATKQKIQEFEANPNSWESQCKNLVEATSKCKNVRITIEANGKQMEVSYPVAGIASRQMVCDKMLSIWHIAPQKLGDAVEEFIKENYPNGHEYRYDIPMKLVSRVESGRKVLWVNPFFEEA